MTIAFIAVGGLSITATAWWALTPRTVDISIPAFAEPEAETNSDAASVPAQTLALAPFEADLWVVPPPAVAPPPPPPRAAPTPPPPHRLLCIMREADGTYAAVVFEPRSDELITLRPGDVLAGYSTESITATTVRFVRDTTEHILDVDQPALRLTFGPEAQP